MWKSVTVSAVVAVGLVCSPLAFGGEPKRPMGEQAFAGLILRDHPASGDRPGG